MLKKITILFGLLLTLSLFITQDVNAGDNYFDCQWIGGACVFKSHDCNDGFGPTNYCETRSSEGQTFCEGLVVSCAPLGATPPPPSCAIEGQYCDTNKPCCSADLTCDAGYSVCVAGKTPFCDSAQGVDTAIGCIPINDIAQMTGFIVAWSIGIGSGIAFLLMLYAGFMMMTSSGQPRRLVAAKELFVSAMAGLILLVFSVFIIRIIGFDILQVMGI